MDDYVITIPAVYVLVTFVLLGCIVFLLLIKTCLACCDFFTRTYTCILHTVKPIYVYLKPSPVVSKEDFVKFHKFPRNDWHHV
uniref:Envelope protein n=1 Tax=Bird deltacoronavirus HKU19 TaxID=3237952 RepID=A0AB39AFM3_9NIDO